MTFGFIRMICQMGIFMICAQAIVHFRPKASYEKYLRMLVSSMILVQIFLAIGSLFTKDFEEKLSQSAKGFMAGFDISLFEEEQWQIPEDILVEEEEDLSEITIQIAPIAPVRVGEVTVGK